MIKKSEIIQSIEEMFLISVSYNLICLIVAYDIKSLRNIEVMHNTFCADIHWIEYVKNGNFRGCTLQTTTSSITNQSTKKQEFE